MFALGRQCTLGGMDGRLVREFKKLPAPTLEVTSLGSGSSGNALLVRTRDAVLLVDCGVGIRRMSRFLESSSLRIADIDALLISHEHSDHVREAPRFAAQETTIVSSRGTARAAALSTRHWGELRPHEALSVAGVEVIAIPVSHDAREPCGFLIRATGGAITVLTDLGAASSFAAEAIAESDLVVLEANHDIDLLRRGPYPIHLQRRILSNSGHLSNDACADLLAVALTGSHRLPTVWLAHLSEANNRPRLAAQTVSQRLGQVGIRLDLHTLPRRDISQTWRAGRAKPGTTQLMFDFPPT